MVRHPLLLSILAASLARNIDTAIIIWMIDPVCGTLLLHKFCTGSVQRSRTESKVNKGTATLHCLKENLLLTAR
jgi:hypothetical protein